MPRSSLPELALQAPDEARALLLDILSVPGVGLPDAARLTQLPVTLLRRIIDGPEPAPEQPDDPGPLDPPTRLAGAPGAL